MDDAPNRVLLLLLLLMLLLSLVAMALSEVTVKVNAVIVAVGWTKAETSAATAHNNARERATVGRTLLLREAKVFILMVLN